MKKWLVWLLPTILVTASPFFFIGGPDVVSPQVFNHLWNLGHVAFFASLVLWILQYRALVFWRDWLCISIAVLGVGAAIEFVQQFVSREASWDDVLHNLFGVWLALCWGQKPTGNRLLLIGLRGLSLVLLLPSLWLVSLAIYNDWRMRAQFPLINSFETSYEWRQLVNIQAQVTKKLSSDYSTQGKYSLAVNLGTDKYSGIKWIGPYGDWGKYHYFELDIYNPDITQLEVTLKIADFQHDRGANELADRFNRRIILTPGWNFLHIDINDIRAAPIAREMKMNEISCLELFASGLAKAQLIYIDNMRLE